MKQVVYPLVVYKDEPNNCFVAKFPDLDIVVDDETIENVYLRACDYLQNYVELMIKYENEFPLPSKYQEIAKKNKEKTILLSKTLLNQTEQMTDEEKKYCDFVKKYFVAED